MTIKYNITGLDCANCAAQLERTIAKVEGVNNVSINFLTQKMELILESNQIDDILKNITKIINKEEPDVELEEI